MLQVSAPPPTAEAPVLSPEPGSGMTCCSSFFLLNNEIKVLQIEIHVLVCAGKKISTAGIAAGVASSVVVLLILSVFAFVRFRRRTKVTDAVHRE